MLYLFYLLTSVRSYNGDFSSFPPALQPAPANPSFTAKYDLSGVPNIPLNGPSNNRGPPTCLPLSSDACSWSCQHCFGPNDVWQCPIYNQVGPTASTPKVLALLAQNNNLKGTFFVIGSQVIVYPDNLLATYNAGHQIAIHTWSHRALTTMTTEVVVAELEYTAMAIQQVIGVRPKYFRPPFGDIDNRIRAIAKAMGLVPVIWNYDTSDWSLNKNSGSPGTVILEHDLDSTVAFASPILQLFLAIGTCVGDNNWYNGVPSLKKSPTSSEVIPIFTISATISATTTTSTSIIGSASSVPVGSQSHQNGALTMSFEFLYHLLMLMFYV